MPETPIATLVAIRAADHPEATPQYERVVFEFSGALPLLRAEYVSELIEDGSGNPVSLPGTVILRLLFTNARAHTDAGQPSVARRLALNLPNVRAVAGAGDFEGVVTYGIGLMHKAHMRIMTLDAPCRVVVDVLRG